MAKSPFSNARNKTIKQQAQAGNISELNLTVTFILKIKGPLSVNLKDWCHAGCDANAPIIKPLRTNYILKIKGLVARQKKDKYSGDTIFRRLEMLRQYIRYCDSKKLNPFSKKGYLAYCGNVGELSRQVSLAIEPKTYTFQYNDGEELGIKETTAGIIRSELNNILTSLGFNVMQYNFLLQDFKRNREVQTKPYQPDEWDVMLRRS